MEQDLLPLDQIEPLADAIGDEFDFPALDGVVRRATAAGLFEKWVGQGDPRRTTAYKLLLALQQEGFVRLFLAHVLSRSPNNTKLRGLIEKASPAALTAKIEIRDQVATVLAGLKVTRD